MLKIVYAPDPILKEVCEPLSQVDDHHRDLIKKMFEAMYEANGVAVSYTHLTLPTMRLV